MAAPQSSPPIPARRQQSLFFCLFLTQVLLIVLFPYLAQSGLPTLMFRLLSALAFLSAVYAVSDKRTQWIAALILAVPSGVLNALFMLRPDLPIAVPSLISAILFLGFTLVLLLRAVLRAETVTRDTIYGALSVYMLMAIVWGLAYMLLETLQPGALAIDLTRHPNHKTDWFDCMFYSFVTLTTLGYGDMIPVTAQSRSLSVLEAMSGIMYVAVLVARLVGVYSSNRSQLKP